MTLICDTTVLYASLDRRDRHHKVCAELVTHSDSLVVPAPALVEIDQLAQRRGIPQATSLFLEELANGRFVLVSPDLEDYARIRALVTMYADLQLGLVDASVVAAAERLGETTVATLDRRHFSVVKPLHCEAFTIVP